MDNEKTGEVIIYLNAEGTEIFYILSESEGSYPDLLNIFVSFFPFFLAGLCFTDNVPDGDTALGETQTGAPFTFKLKYLFLIRVNPWR